MLDEPAFSVTTRVFTLSAEWGTSPIVGTKCATFLRFSVSDYSLKLTTGTPALPIWRVGVPCPVIAAQGCLIICERAATRNHSCSRWDDGVQLGSRVQQIEEAFGAEYLSGTKSPAARA